MTEPYATGSDSVPEDGGHDDENACLLLQETSFEGALLDPATSSVSEDPSSWSHWPSLEQYPTPMGEGSLEGLLDFPEMTGLPSTQNNDTSGPGISGSSETAEFRFTDADLDDDWVRVFNDLTLSVPSLPFSDHASTSSESMIFITPLETSPVTDSSSRHSPRAGNPVTETVSSAARPSLRDIHSDALQLTQLTAQREVPESTLEQSQTIVPTSGKRKRRRPTSEEKNKTNEVRQKVACLRCQALRESCDDHEPCQRCEVVSATAKVWEMPCCRARITDVALFRTGFLSFPNGIRKIEEWSSPRKIKVDFVSSWLARQGVPNAGGRNVSVICQQFNPLPMDPVVRKWNQGKSEVRIPSFAIAKGQLSEATRALTTFATGSPDVFIDQLKSGKDPLVVLTMQEAQRLSHKYNMISSALRLCVLSKLCSTTVQFSDDKVAEKMGIPLLVDPAARQHYTSRPVPLVLDAQIQSIWMGVMRKLRKKLLAELRLKIFGRRREHWYSIYITAFLVLWNLEYCYEHQKERLDIFCQKHPRQSFPFPSLSMMDSWELAARNILTHFHVISQGNIPFAKHWEDGDDREALDIDDEAFEYLQKIQLILTEQEHRLREKAIQPPGTPLVWVSSLFFPPAAE